jgi:transcriptional regulator with XRE-family HTH domain
MAPRRRLAQRRETLGYTQRTLAKGLRVQRSTVVRWENGSRAPQPWVRPQLAAALDISPEQLDHLLADTNPATDTDPGRVIGYPAHADAAPVAFLGPENDDDMKRRELLRLVSMASALLALAPTSDLDTDRLTYAANQPSRLDDTTLDEYGRLNVHLWQVFALSPSKAETLPMVRRQLDVLTDSLQHHQTTAVHARLCALAGDLFQLAGEIYFDGNRYTEAAHCYTLAASASKQADTYDLWACALTRHAFIAVYERQYGHAAPMLNLAGALATRGDSGLSTRYWVAAVQAETYAGLGNLTACQRALDDAEHVRSLTGDMHNGGWLRFDGSRLAEERGTCYVTLGRPDLAEAALIDALKQDLSPRRRASVLTDLAILGAQRGDPDRVLTFTRPVLTTARQTSSGVISRKLHALQPYLTPLLGDHRMQRLHTDITALARQGATH